MSKESQAIPIDENTREVKMREQDGQTSLVLVDHAGRKEVVPVVLAPKAQARRAA